MLQRCYHQPPVVSSYSIIENNTIPAVKYEKNPTVRCEIKALTVFYRANHNYNGSGAVISSPVEVQP
jgi:hypothetical protein